MTRDDKGRFVNGISGNPSGRPPKKREERFLEVTLEACTFEDWRKIIIKAIEQAKRGDSMARKFLADYLIGPPVQRQEHTGKDGGPIKTESEVKIDLDLRPDELSDFLRAIKDAGLDGLADGAAEVDEVHTA
jgi:hypothetical protein